MRKALVFAIAFAAGAALGAAYVVVADMLDALDEVENL